MLTGFAALKYGATLALMPFSFAYVPELLLQGGWFDIAYTTTLYALGCALLAMGIQGTLLFGPRYAPLPSRLLFGLGGGAFMFPTSAWVDLAGLAVSSEERRAGKGCFRSWRSW